MVLSDTLDKAGHLFFRFRSFLLPVLAVPLLVVEANDYRLAHGANASAYELLCLLIAMAGVAIRGLTVGFVSNGTSGRNTTRQKAECLNTTGTYSVVRNPLYWGNYLVFMGITLMIQDWEVLLINNLLFAAVYVPIVYAEERFLLNRFGRDYQRYARKVPCWIPSFRRWKSPRRDWSWRMLLRREHDTVFSAILGLAAIEFYRDFLASRGHADIPWIVLLATSGAAWLVLKYLKRCTSVLKIRHGALGGVNA